MIGAGIAATIAAILLARWGFGKELKYTGLWSLTCVLLFVLGVSAMVVQVLSWGASG
jgi:amino acid permease